MVKKSVENLSKIQQMVETSRQHFRDAGYILLLAVIIGAVILSIFRLLFPQTPITEFINITTVFSILLAFVLFKLRASKSLKKQQRKKIEEKK